MIHGSCSNPDCTVAQTGICLESHKTVSECPNFISIENSQTSTDNIDLPTLPNDKVEVQPPLISLSRQFHSGNEMGVSDITKVTQKRYSHIIGVLGSTNVGKTCLISSLYLLACQGKLLPDYLFAGSYTLKGFEERVWRLRNWEKGRLPTQFVDHTHLLDPRQPAFMHLCIKENKTNGKFKDLLISDLPGEWTDQLIDSDDAVNKFTFLQRADCILYVIDGPMISDDKTKNNEIYRIKIALDRLVHNISIDLAIPIVFVISKGDVIDMKFPSGLHDIINYASKYNLVTFHVITIAFSNNPDKYMSGLGVYDVFTKALSNHSSYKNFSVLPGERSFWSSCNQ